MSATYCPLPWNSINLRNNGDMRICCNTNSYTKNRGILRKKDGTPFNAGKDNWEQARNSVTLKEVRASMLKGEWHPECERCRQEEINGIKSRRQYELDQWSLPFNIVREHTIDEGAIDTAKIDIEFMDLRYGNFCNLKCRMCGPTDSHQWYEDFVNMFGYTGFTDTHGRVELVRNKKGRLVPENNDYAWFENSDNYWNEFEKNSNDVKKMYIVGGEPLIIPEHEETLQRLVDKGHSNDIEIEYNSNLTNVTDKVIKLWENFKQIRVGASIDGYGNVFDYQRTPAKWNHVYKNLKKLNDNKNINLKCWFAYTVTPYNVFHLPEFMKWKLTESNLDRFNYLEGPHPIVTHHMCHSPKYYNIKVLPNLIKNDVVEQFEFYKEWINSTNFSKHIKNNFAKTLDGVSNFMLSEDISKDIYSEDRTNLDMFILKTKRLDELRSQDVARVVPELAELFNENF